MIPRTTFKNMHSTLGGGRAGNSSRSVIRLSTKPVLLVSRSCWYERSNILILHVCLAQKQLQESFVEVGKLLQSAPHATMPDSRCWPVGQIAQHDLARSRQNSDLG